MNWRKPSLVLLTLTALLLAGTMSAAAAPPAQERGQRTAVFGEVVANDAGVLTVRTKGSRREVQLGRFAVKSEFKSCSCKRKKDAEKHYVRIGRICGLVRLCSDLSNRGLDVVSRR